MRTYIIMIIGLAISNLTYAQFPQISLNDIFSVDSSEAWVVGEKGTIIHIMEGGMYWEDLSYNTNLSLHSIFFIDDLLGYIVGEGGMVLRTNDGGISWEPIDMGVSYGFESIVFTDSVHGWISPILYWGHGLFRTVNAGSSWEYYNTEPYHPFFINSQDGWGSNAGSGEVFVRRTYNGGANWEDIYILQGSGLPYYYFLSPDIGFMSLFEESYTNCYNSYDGGESWQQNNLIIDAYQTNDILFLDSVSGWVCANEYIFYSNDFFDTYISFYQILEEFNALSIHGVSSGWAVSYNDVDLNSTIWKLDEFNDWYPIETIGIGERQGVQSLEVFPNPFTNVLNIAFNLSTPSTLQLEIYNSAGRRIGIQKEGLLESGKHHISWPGNGLDPGVYFLILKDHNKKEVMKVIKYE